MHKTYLTAMGLGSLLCSPLHASDFLLDPFAHINTTIGASSTDEDALASHAHDPNDEFSLQGIELGFATQYGDHFASFVNYNLFLDLDNKLDGEWEEAFIKLRELPGGFEVRGGRLLNRVTSQNNVHLHGWHFIDANLITARFLGDEGLLTNSAELSWRLPTEHTSMISVAYGDAIAHDHEHGHHEDHDDHHDDDDDDHDEEIHGEEAALADDIITVRWMGQYNHTDFHQFTYGASFMTGDNGYGKSTDIYGLDLQYMWRENGLEPGGKHIRTLVEAVYREFDFASEDGDVSGSAEEWGIHTHIGYGFMDNWELGARYGYIEGVDHVEELPERHRASLALTRSFEFNDYAGGHARLQYNHDHSSEFGGEDSIWLQFQFDFGKGNEIR
ncbi:hypothetical protein Rhal01_01600 [Rubritalea halochordaticola]|uniref:Porin n=1 Tax=Rubritalea halochordaticola TaxID=714537 RepID=A0ABP9V0C4_9BACT